VGDARCWRILTSAVCPTVLFSALALTASGCAQNSWARSNAPYCGPICAPSCDGAVVQSMPAYAAAPETNYQTSTADRLERIQYDLRDIKSGLGKLNSRVDALEGKP
jgi:hypothetical protein